MHDFRRQVAHRSLLLQLLAWRSCLPSPFVPGLALHAAPQIGWRARAEWEDTRRDLHRLRICETMAYRSIAMLQRHVANDIVQDRTAYFEQLAFEANDAAEK